MSQASQAPFLPITFERIGVFYYAAGHDLGHPRSHVPFKLQQCNELW
jgi:hypothetical protein